MPDLERIQQLTPGTLSQQWYEDGAVVDPGTVTVGITRWDGTVLVAAGAATAGTTTGPRTYNLTTTHTALLDRLTVTWTSTLKGTLVSYVEVVGGVLFSIAQARTLAPLNNTTTYPTSTLVDMRTTVEQAIEDACGVAFVPRYRLDTIAQENDPLLVRPKLRTVRSLTLNGTVYTTDQIAAMTVTNDGRIYTTMGASWRISDTGWAWGATSYRTTVATVGYEHGYDVPPSRVSRAAMLLARAWLVTGPIDDRASTFTSADSGGTYSLVTPGRSGSLFGVPEVDVIVQQYGMIGVA